MNASGQFSFSSKLKNDLSLNEGDEILQIKLFTDSSRSAVSQVGQTASVTVKDTSKRTYSLATNAATIDEGKTLTTTVNTTGVATNTTLYWELSGNGINASDIDAPSNPNPLRGEGKVNASGQFSFSSKIKNDLSINEGDETLQIKLYTDPSRSAISQVGQTASVTIKDTSRKQLSSTLYATDPITGERVYTDSVRSGGWGYTPTASSGEYEWELSSKTLIYTERHFDYRADPSENRWDVSRLVLQGSYQFKDGKVTGETTKTALFTVDSVRGKPKESASFTTVSKSSSNPIDLTSYPSWASNTTKTFTRIDGGITRSQLIGLPSAEFFPQNWWTNPFEGNLI